MAAVGFELAQRGFALYLENFSDYSAIYGSLGAVITFLVFIYIAAMVFLLGAEMATLWPRVRAGEFEDWTATASRSASRSAASCAAS